jgi:TLC domain
MSAIASFLTTLPYHAHQAIAACLSYFALFLIISPTLSACVAPNPYRTLPRRTQINWNVRVVSFIQATFICICSIHVILADGARTKTNAMGRLLSYSPMAGRVQAFAAGYFGWDLLVSLLHLRVLGLGSLVHATSALLVTIIGFVSSRIASRTVSNAGYSGPSPTTTESTSCCTSSRRRFSIYIGSWIRQGGPARSGSSLTAFA